LDLFGFDRFACRRIVPFFYGFLVCCIIKISILFGLLGTIAAPKQREQASHLAVVDLFAMAGCNRDFETRIKETAEYKLQWRNSSAGGGKRGQASIE